VIRAIRAGEGCDVSRDLLELAQEASTPREGESARDGPGLVQVDDP